MRPLSVFGPSSGKSVPSLRLSMRRDAMPSTTTLPSGSRWKLSAPPGDWVVNSPTISSRMSSSVTRPSSSPYSSTTSPRRCCVAWNCCSWASSGVPAGMKYGGRRVVLSRGATSASSCLRRSHHVVDLHRVEVEQVREHRPMLSAQVLAFEHERAQLLLGQRRMTRIGRSDGEQLEERLHEEVDEPDHRRRQLEHRREHVAHD